MAPALGASRRNDRAPPTTMTCRLEDAGNNWANSAGNPPASGPPAREELQPTEKLGGRIGRAREHRAAAVMQRGWPARKPTSIRAKRATPSTNAGAGARGATKAPTMTGSQAKRRRAYTNAGVDRPVDAHAARFDIDGLATGNEVHDKPDQPRRAATPLKDGTDPLRGEPLEGLALIEEQGNSPAATGRLGRAGRRRGSVSDRT
eukprot:15435605-Alexandrium_andersonii.AAC.1